MMPLPYNKGEAITKKSFQIIRDRLGPVSCSPEVLEIITRIAHTTGDVEFAKTFHIPEKALAGGIRAAQKGCPLITDVEMVKTGIRKSPANRLGCHIHCFLNDPRVHAESQKTGQTRSHLGMVKAGELLHGAIVAIGNAPTALFQLLTMVEQGRVNPALIIGVPVGFVGALESKQALFDSGFPGITNLSERGGSTIAAAIVNGILHLAASPGN
jgi:precorrin-8X/cobalt-precorrin-8 methylmutase